MYTLQFGSELILLKLFIVSILVLNTINYLKAMSRFAVPFTKKPASVNVNLASLSI